MSQSDSPQPGEMHPIDRAFYELVIKERDYERRRVDQLEAENARLTQQQSDSQEVEDLRHALRWALALVALDADEFEGEAAEDYSGATRIAWPDQPERWA